METYLLLGLIGEKVYDRKMWQGLRLWYTPDFLARLDDGSYQLIEVKDDNKIDDTIVKAKAETAQEIAVASGIEYKMYAGSEIMKTHILSYLDKTNHN